MKTRLYIKFVSVVAAVLLSFVSCVKDKFPSVPVDFVYVNATDSEVLMNAYSYMYDLEQTYSIDPGSSLILTGESSRGLVDGYPSKNAMPLGNFGFLRVWVNGVMTEYGNGDANSPFDIRAYALPSDDTLTYTYVFK